MKKLLIFILTYLILLSLTIQAQNEVWSLPSNYYKVGNGVFPLISPGGNTIGFSGFPLPNFQPNQQATHNHNAMQDANGDLLFFVVDGAVYDKDGYVIGVMNDNSLSYINNGTELFGDLRGYSETMIIPVPGNCQQYYIVTQSTVGAGAHGVIGLHYATLDLSITSLNTGREGILLVNNPALDIGNGEGEFSAINTINLGIQTPNYSFPLPAETEPNNSMAVTNLRNNTRFLFANGMRDLYRFNVTSTGITYSGYSFSLDFTNNIPSIDEVATRSEMEIIETTTGYRLAFAYPSKPTTSLQVKASTLFVANLNNNGDVVTSTLDTKNLLNDAQDVRADIKGLEFSPNGDYLYITHDINTNNPDGFKIYNVATQNFLSNATINNAQLFTDMAASGFKNSYIELANDGNLPVVHLEKVVQ